MEEGQKRAAFARLCPVETRFSYCWLTAFILSAKGENVKAFMIIRSKIDILTQLCRIHSAFLVHLFALDFRGQFVGCLR